MNAAAEKQQLLDAIRRAVEESTMRPVEIARRSGVTKGALSRFLAGSGLSVESLEKLAPVLGIEIVIRKKR